MKTFKNIHSLRKELNNKKNIAFVPTMGNLHDGHLALIKHAQKIADHVIVSIFVNQLQFLPNEDFNLYPRTLTEDCEKLNALGVNFLFAPSNEILYPNKQDFLLILPPVANILEGQFRPGFFVGVTTVVLKLFNIIQPHIALFGKKDFQQLFIIKEMVLQLNLPIKIEPYVIIRTPDGLALSSRNHYLTKTQRAEANNLFLTLKQIKNKVHSGCADFKTLQKDAIENLHQRGWKVDYLTILNSETLSPAKINDNNLIVLCAAWLGKTRLIDNIEI